MFYYLLEDDLILEKDMIVVKNVHDFPVFIGTALFALEAVGVVSTFAYLCFLELAISGIRSRTLQLKNFNPFNEN